MREMQTPTVSTNNKHFIHGGSLLGAATAATILSQRYNNERVMWSFKESFYIEQKLQSCPS